MASTSSTPSLSPETGVDVFQHFASLFIQLRFTEEWHTLSFRSVQIDSSTGIVISPTTSVLS